MNKTFEEMVKDESGTIYIDRIEHNIRYLIMRGPVGLCAYLGISKDHPLAGKNYYDVDLGVHGGLTFSEIGDGKRWPKDFWWYGWDYSHAGDYPFYYDDPAYLGVIRDDYIFDEMSKKWSIKEVEQEIKEILPEFKKLMKQAEKKNEDD